MQKSLLIKLSTITALCAIFVIGLSMLASLVSERQYYADSVISDIADQHFDPQNVITPFIVIPTTTSPSCNTDTNATAPSCAASYTKLETVFPTQTQATQDIDVSTDTYKRGTCHAISYEGQLNFNQQFNLAEALDELETTSISNAFYGGLNNQTTKTTDIRTDHQMKLIIPISDLRGVSSLPVVTIHRAYKATYPKDSLISGLSYVELNLPSDLVNTPSDIAATKDLYAADNNHSHENETSDTKQSSNVSTSSSRSKVLKLQINTPLSGISRLATIPTGQNFELNLKSNWTSPNFIGRHHDHDA